MEAGINLGGKEINITKNTESPERSLCISQIEKEVEIDFKVENIQINEIHYPSIDQRINFSYLDQSMDNDPIIEKKVNTELDEFITRDTQSISQKDFQLLPNQSDIINKTEISRKSRNSLTSTGKNFYSNFSKINGGDSSPSTDIQNMSKKFPFLSVVEKCEVKDFIGFHKQYEIQLLNEKETKIKCHRRYNHFYKFHQKISRIYPYVIIPKLTPKNPLSKVIKPEEDFYPNRRIQLELYINYIFSNDLLSQSKEFQKFVNEAEFDEVFFTSNDRELFYTFPNSLKITDNLKNKIFSVFSGIFGEKDLRIPSSEEIELSRMEIHYRSITEKYSDIKTNVVNFLKTVKINSETYLQLSNCCLYLKDSFEDLPDAKGKFLNSQNVSLEVSELNNYIYQNRAKQLENQFEFFISNLLGLCDTFTNYSNFKIILENVLKAYRYAKKNKFPNLEFFYYESELCEKLKIEFDKNLIEGIKNFCLQNNNTLKDLMDEFKNIIKIINSKVLSVKID